MRTTVRTTCEMKGAGCDGHFSFGYPSRVPTGWFLFYLPDNAHHPCCAERDRAKQPSSDLYRRERDRAQKPSINLYRPYLSKDWACWAPHRGQDTKSMRNLPTAVGQAQRLMAAPQRADRGKAHSPDSHVYLLCYRPWSAANLWT